MNLSKKAVSSVSLPKQILTWCAVGFSTVLVACANPRTSTIAEPRTKPQRSIAQMPPDEGPTTRTGSPLFNGDTAVTRDCPEKIIEAIIADPPDALVVLGARTRHGLPGIHMAQRIHIAQQIDRALGRRPLILLTGGNGGEALTMQHLMSADGVAEERMAIEPDARNTWENAVNSDRILLEAHRHIQSVLVITTAVSHPDGTIDDHARRALPSFRSGAPSLRISAVSCNVRRQVAPHLYMARRLQQQ